jgi:hypothetical protein
MLKYAPLLQSLYLFSIIPQCPGASSSSPCTTTPLTQLSNLRLVDVQLADCVHFATHIVFPKTAAVSFATGSWSLEPLPQDVLDSWDAMVPSQHDDRKYHLAFTLSYEGELSLILSHLDQPEIPFRSLRFPHWSDSQVENTIQRVCRQTVQKISNITHLELTIQTGMFSWIDILDGMDEVVDLRVTKLRVESFDDLILALRQGSGTSHTRRG